MRRRFRVAMNDDYGMLGFAPLWIKGEQADPLSGMGAAHDVLEHGSHDECEWQGLGGSVYVRGLTGYFGRTRGNPDPVENISSEFDNLFNLWQGQPIPDPGQTQPLRDERAEEMVQAVVRRGCLVVRAACAGLEARSARRWTNAEQQRRMIGWMRRGYRACAQRWRGRSGDELRQTFQAIEEVVDRFLRREQDLIEGTDVTLVFDVRLCEARIESTRDDWFED